MSSRIEVELTSNRPDGIWTWRAAGAKEPKGTLNADLLYEGAKVGDIVRADVAFDLDGISVEAVLAPKAKVRSENTLQLIAKEQKELVTSNLAKRRPGDKRGQSDRRSFDDRPDRKGPRGDSRTDQRPRTDRPGPRPDSRRTEAGESRGPRPAHAATARPDRSGGGGTDNRPNRGPRPDGGPTRGRTDGERTNRAPRMQIGNTHRIQLINSLPEEHRAVADQLSRGGMSAVRSALAASKEATKGENLPESSDIALLKLAEQLDPQVRLAFWLDRADAILKDVTKAGLRDIRAAVTAADSFVKDDKVRELTEQLRAVWKERSERTLAEWLKSISDSLDENRIIRALRLASRPPEPTAKFPAELAAKLVELTNASMATDTPPERWLSLMEAVAESPVRRQIVPVGLPEGASAEQTDAIKQESGRIPALAKLLGIAIPPPPKPRAARPPMPKRSADAQQRQVRKAPAEAAVTEAPAEAAVAEVVTEAPAEVAVAEDPTEPTN